MSCPDWTRLTLHRHGGAAAAPAEPAGWQTALAHLDGCVDCRRRALAADPSLVFRRLAGDGAAAAVDVEAMRQGVAAMRRARRVLPAGGRSRPGGETLGRLARAGRAAAAAVASRGWTRIAAALLLAAGLLTAAPGGHHPRAGGESAAAAARTVSPPPPGATFGGAVFAAAPAAREPDELPVFEGLDRPRDANVYQLDGEGLLVVMIVDETLDV